MLRSASPAGGKNWRSSYDFGHASATRTGMAAQHLVRTEGLCSEALTAVLTAFAISLLNYCHIAPRTS